MTAVQESSAFSLYRPPISVRAYASPCVFGWKTIPGTKPPPPPMWTLSHEKAAQTGHTIAVSSWRYLKHLMVITALIKMMSRKRKRVIAFVG